MRRFWIIALLAAGLLESRASAQTLPAEMVVTVPQVEVRSGPTKEYYATGVLRQGERVLVLRQSKDQPGWLAIKPPAGSFSWVNAKNVKQVDPRTAYVDMDSGPVAVMPGSSIVNRAPNVESVKIAPGFLVTIVDKPFTVESDTWLPIQPPPTEVRFIPADAVRSLGAGQPLVPASASGNPLLTQADEAFQAGQFDRARQLYREVADRTADYQQKIYCYNRLMSLDKGSVATPGYPDSRTPTAGPTFLPASNKTITYPPQWSSWGVLRRASFERDGLPVYVLESRQGQALLHAVGQAGTSLRDYEGKMVCLYGSISTRSDDALRTHYMIASHVAVP